MALSTAKMVIANLVNGEYVYGHRIMDVGASEVYDISINEFKSIIKDNQEAVANLATFEMMERFPRICKDTSGGYKLADDSERNKIFVLCYFHGISSKLAKVCNSLGEMGLLDVRQLNLARTQSKIVVCNRYANDYEGAEDDVPDYDAIGNEEAKVYRERCKMMGLPELRFINSLHDSSKVELDYCVGAKDVVIIPNFVDVLRTGMFLQSAGSSIRTVSLGAGVKQIYEQAFSGIELAKVYLNEGLEQIKDTAFGSMVFDGTLVIPSTVSYIGEYALRETRVTELVVNSIKFAENMGGLAWLRYIGSGTDDKKYCQTLRIREELAVKIIRYFGSRLKQIRYKDNVDVRMEQAIINRLENGSKKVEWLSRLVEKHWGGKDNTLKVSKEEASEAIKVLINHPGFGVNTVEIV